LEQIIELSINGEIQEAAVESQVTLLEVLRGQLGLTGTKEACGTGECGSCTVLMDGKPILSCLILAVDCQRHEITTIEGLSTGGGLSPVQQAFQDVGAIQCGFCTPGMILTATALIENNPLPSEEDIKKSLEGNLCRCTGYNKIMEAVKLAAERGTTK
jgi:aerobic-type carbon monoxide dehydrogenase small subunit (CoxS/CutS family)